MDEQTKFIRELSRRVEAVCPIVGLSWNKGEGIRIDFAPQATAEERAAANAIVAAADENTFASERAEVLEQVKIQAQSAVDVLLTDLSQAQIKSLLAVLLWRAGAIGYDGKIRLLKQWFEE